MSVCEARIAAPAPLRALQGRCRAAASLTPRRHFLRLSTRCVSSSSARRCSAACGVAAVKAQWSGDARLPLAGHCKVRGKHGSARKPGLRGCKPATAFQTNLRESRQLPMPKLLTLNLPGLWPGWPAKQTWPSQHPPTCRAHRLNGRRRLARVERRQLAGALQPGARLHQCLRRLHVTLLQSSQGGSGVNLAKKAVKRIARKVGQTIRPVRWARRLGR